MTPRREPKAGGPPTRSFGLPSPTLLCVGRLRGKISPPARQQARLPGENEKRSKKKNIPPKKNPKNNKLAHPTKRWASFKYKRGEKKVLSSFVPCTATCPAVSVCNTSGLVKIICICNHTRGGLWGWVGYLKMGGGKMAKKRKKK